MRRYAFQCRRPRYLVLFAAALSAVIGVGRIAGASDHGQPAPNAEVAANDTVSDAKSRGVELGDYRIRTYYPIEAQKSTVRFQLYAAVASERLADARHVLEHRMIKLRDEVIIVTRMSPLTIFDDPDLTEFRRRILVRLRRALPELPIDDIFIGDFCLSVKSL